MFFSYRQLLIGLLTLVSISILWSWPRLNTTTSFPFDTTNPSSSHQPLTEFSDHLAQYFIDYPPSGPKYADQFGELGSRVRVLREWASASPEPNTHIERVLLHTFPFLKNPSTPDDPTPFHTLRTSFHGRGIVIPTGRGSFRFAAHLILSTRNVHHSKLPIQIVYAGEDDLPQQYRQLLGDLANGISFLDILTVFDDSTLKLAKGGWAIKAFAALAAPFEVMILLDADAVFVQSPEKVFAQRGYVETGALLYHDRLLWQHAFKNRHDWWKKQMEHHEPSAALLMSKVWMEDYAEEGDSGVVVLDKGRLEVVMGLLHVAWQNSAAVREEVTYKLTYGDKESWWFGFELSGTPFAFERHYGSIAGESKHDQKDGKTEEEVCAFTIAHTDDGDGLLWYNGSLLKNKAVDKETFDVPSHWIVGSEGTWRKGGSKPEMSCIIAESGKGVRELSAEEKRVIERSIEEARRFDGMAREKGLLAG
jgi:alpha 1,3-mannosyltransferase